MGEYGRVMGLDIGDVRIGVALSDPMRMIASPHAVVKEASRDAAIAAIKKIADEQEVVRIVAGVPLNEAGGHGIQADKTLAFIERLRAAVTVEVVIQDERYSTAAANRMLIGANVRRDKRKLVVDKIAATHILQSHLDRAASDLRAREQRPMTRPDEPDFDTPRRPWTFYRILATAVLFGLATLLLAGVAGGVVAFVVYDHVTQPGVAGPEVEVVVPQKATGRDVGRILADNGLIEHESFFRLALQIDGTNQPLRSGAYRLHRGNSALELLRELYKGPLRQVVEAQFKLTVPEGLTIRQASELVKDPQGFIDAARDPALIKRLGIEAESLEGFLMPNTYFFDAEPEARVLVERMVAQFEKEYKKLAAEVPGGAKLSRVRIVTIASLVEEETKVDEERPLVARVVYNRIDKKMPLQLDSTLQFALNKYGQRLLYEDREVDSPYNTYIKNGLPPGPISSPGAASLRAALHPADTKNLYFVSNADGRTHTFSNTEEEHVKAVAKFRREIGPQREALEKQRELEQQTRPAAPSGGAPIIPATPTDESP